MSDKVTDPKHLPWEGETLAQKEAESFRYIVHEYDDFWEWYENHYPHTKTELFKEFDAFNEKH